MLKIRELNIEGFKSFRTLDVKLLDGLTVVVGPNGCGKSNLFDSILFALGNTSSKKLRYANIEELINKSSEDKIAKVSVTLENEDKKESYKITREVSEKGSVFRLNNSRTTLEAITSLLSGYGIYPDGHNFILQDKIKKITEATDLERKKIIDEIAGVEQFEEKISSTKDNLEKVNSKIEKITIALNEKDEWLKSLREQKETAEKYIEYNNRKVTIKAIILRKQKESLERELNRLHEKIESNEKNIEELEAAIKIGKEQKEALEIEQKEISKAFEKIYDSFDKIKIQFSKKELIIQNEEREESRLEREIKYALSTIESKKKEIESINTKIEDIDKKIKDVQQELRNLPGAVVETKQFTTADYSTELEKIDNLIFDLRNKLNEQEKNPQELLDKINECDDTKEKIKELERDLKALEVEKSTIENNSSEEENIISVQTAQEIQEIINELIQENRFGTFVFALENSEFEDCEIENTQKSGDLYVTTISPTERLNSLDTQINEINKNISIFTKTLELKESEKEQLVSKIEEEKEINKNKITADINKKLESRKKVLAEIEKVKDEINKIKLAQRQQAELNNKKIEVEKLKEEVKYKIELISLAKEEIKKSERQISETEKEKLKIVSSIAQKKAELTQEKTMLDSEKEKHLEIKNKKADIENRVLENSQKLSSDKNGLLMKKNEIDIYENEINLKRNGLKELDEEIENFIKSNKGFIIDTGSKEISKAAHLLRNELTELEDNIIKLGAVNHKAIEDYNTLSKEVGEIEEKANKLKEEKDKVQELLDKISFEKNTAFMENFNAIKTHFEKNVFDLNLGNSELVLTDKDLDLAGVRINLIQKKKKRNLQSLSGGEKSLVSIAFILSVLQHRPASFYLLDEIDAALDYQNTDKVVKLIKELSKNTQILLISHNTETIKLCDYVLGITKNTRGTSIIGVTKELIS